MTSPFPSISMEMPGHKAKGSTDHTKVKDIHEYYTTGTRHTVRPELENKVLNSDGLILGGQIHRFLRGND